GRSPHGGSRPPLARALGSRGPCADPEPGLPDPRSPAPDRRPPWDADGVRRVPAPGRGDLAGPRARRRIRRQRAIPPEPRVPAIPTQRRGGGFRRTRSRADPRNLAVASVGTRVG